MPDLSNSKMPANTAAELSPVKRALQEIRNLRARVEELESGKQLSQAREPIAIIGAGLRFPGGVVDEASFWDLLSKGKDAITEIPRERWDWRAYFNADADAPGSMYTRHGGFLDGIDLFDAAFFGVSPREAVAMDPQHRLILEVGWEALENAGYSPTALQGSSTGVFLGLANSDYGRAALTDLESIDAYTGSGNSPAMVAGRLSYVLGLHGPSLAIDTSCSSSLVAVHLACVSLLSGECKLALAGGVNLSLSPELNVALSKARMMARDGRCKTFDEAADGYVRAEGCSIVVLKKLSDAISDGDRVLAVIRGSAVNHDGRSGGLTAPNGPAQAAVMQKALETAGLNAAEISYVETHGTGTALGDPIEVETLASLMGAGRSANTPLAIGSVKTNIGHAETASGVAGLMKTVLALGHREIPPSLHLNQKSSHIDWPRLPVTVPTQALVWKPLNGHRYAGVSSFGFSGTNAHVVLEESPEPQLSLNVRERPRQILAISARTQTALDGLCARYADALRACAEDRLADLCFTANSGRTHFTHRIAVVGETAGQMAMELERTGLPDAASRRFTGMVEDAESLRTGYLFTGQGSQYVGMGRELYESSLVFREGIERCAAAWKQETGESLTEVLYPEGEEGKGTSARRMEEARYAQPALYAFEYALAELWRSWGIEPSVVLGHSLGEYVAAVIAGVFSMEDGLRLVCARARLMDTLAERGGKPGAMRSIGASAERVRRAMAGYESEVAVAVINGPETVVLSGAAERVEEIAKKLEAEGVRTRVLQVTHGFHSPLLEPILEEFEECARKVTYHAPRIRIVSNLTGETARAEEITTPRYWREHMRGTVLFHPGLETALATGCHTFLEIGPQPHLKALAVRIDETLEKRIGISLRRPRSDWDQMLETLARLYVQGHPIDWNGFDRGYRRTRVALPMYPFDRQRYWLTTGTDTSEDIWRRSTAAALSQSRMAPIGLNVESFADKWNCLDRLTIAEITETLRELGAFTKPGSSHDAASLTASLGISVAHTKLMGRWLGLLCHAGYLERDGSQFVARTPLPTVQLGEVWREVDATFSDDPFLLEYVRNCSKHLRGVLLGTTSPLETLFPGGSPDLARNLYENSVGQRYANLIVAAAIQSAGTVVPADRRRLRVLELGAGTGSATSAILPKLPGDRVSYLFTDVSDVFLHRASARFAEYPFLRYGLLDIENRDHLAQHAGSFDVVVAANVVHATRDLQATLAGIVGLLAPGGTLVLLETTKNMAWHDITTGLIEGWQKSDDDLRGTKTLLGVEEWSAALRQAEFSDVVSAPEVESVAGEIGLHVILARAPSVGGTVFEPVATITGKQSPTWTHTAFTGSNADELSSAMAVPKIDALLREAPQSERQAILLNVVSQEIARVLRLAEGTLPGKRDRLMDLGVDSLMAVELRNRLAARLDVESLPATLIFDYPTPDAIAGYLLSLVEQATPIAVERSSPQQAEEKMFTAEEVADLAEEDVAMLLRGRLGR